MCDMYVICILIDYIHDSTMIPKNTSVLVKRVPALKGRAARARRESLQQQQQGAERTTCSAVCRRLIRYICKTPFVDFFVHANTGGGGR